MSIISPSTFETLPPVLFDSNCHRSSTAMLRFRAVEQAIATMRERFTEQLTLPEIARSAQLSPFHFTRVFRSMTGISPSVFLAALRLEEAKRLLMTTQRSVTEICFDVGYSSLGTFTSRFTLFVGIPPTRFRLLLREQIMHQRLHNLQFIWDTIQQQQQRTLTGTSVTGQIHLTSPFQGFIFIGLFADPLPQGMPLGCTVLTAPGTYHIPSVPDGKYYVFAAALDGSKDLLSILECGTTFHGGIRKDPLVVCKGQVKGHSEIVLAPTRWADPPLLIALPWLLLSRFLPHYTQVIQEKNIFPEVERNRYVEQISTDRLAFGKC